MSKSHCFCCSVEMTARCFRRRNVYKVYLLGTWSSEKEEKLLIELDLVAHEFTISSVSLLKEIKHHIKTQYILGGKIKTQKGPILSSEMQLSVL